MWVDERYEYGELRMIVRHPLLTAGPGEIGSTKISTDFTQALQNNPAAGNYTARAESFPTPDRAAE